MAIDLFNADCFERLKDIPDNSIDCIITDPPYGNTNCSWDCINAGRSFLGYELDEGYYNIALQRIERAKIDKAETLPIEWD